jgi:hypothetical protein
MNTRRKAYLIAFVVAAVSLFVSLIVSDSVVPVIASAAMAGYWDGQLKRLYDMGQ